MQAVIVKNGKQQQLLMIALREATTTGMLAMVLVVPFLGLKAENAGISLKLETHWFTVFWIVGLAIISRVLLVLWRVCHERSVYFHRISVNFTRISRIFKDLSTFVPNLPAHSVFWLGVGGILFAFILPVMFPDRYVIDTATTLLIYVMLGWGLNIVVGLAGLLDLGYVAFYAVGAYSYALLSTQLGWSFWLCLPVAGLLAATFGIILGFPVLRLRGDYLAIVTLGFGEIVRVVLINWSSVTNGSQGIAGIPRPSFFGLPFGAATAGGLTFSEFFGISYSPLQRIIFLYYLILVLALVTNAFTLRIRSLPVGRAWEALREDEIACRALGINPTTVKLSAFAIGAMFAGLAGSFFATRQAFVSPESFTFLESAIILAIVVLGGMGSQTGVVIAALVLVVLPEWFRDFTEYRMLLFGAAMVVIMVWRPRGLLAQRDPTLRLAEHPALPIGLQSREAQEGAHGKGTRR